MKNSKLVWRLFPLLLALCALVLLLAACNGGRNGGTEGSGTEAVYDCTHENTKWTPLNAATCTAKGALQKICRDCNAVLETVETDRLPHSEEIVKGTTATCTQTGLSDGKKCAVCNEVLVEQTVIEKKAHTETVIPGRFAACGSTGLSDGVKCSVCNTVITAQTEIAALSHAEGGWIVDSVAKVGTEGSMHTECTLCGAVMQREIIPALDASHVHAGNAWTVTAPAKCDAEGVESFLCVCGEVTETRAIAKIAHTERNLPARDATCMAKGLTAGKDCSVCGEILVAQKEIAMKEHTEQTVLGYAPTCDAPGLTDGSCCAVCTVPLASRVEIPPTGHNFSNGFCENCTIPVPQSVWIVDGLGNPVSDVYVRIMKGNEQVKMVAYDGEFLIFTGLEENETYTLSLDLSSLGNDYVYDEASAIITPDEPCATIRIFRVPKKDSSTTNVAAPINGAYKMYEINAAGSYKLTLTPNDYTFFIFAPPAAAIYTATYVCSEELSLSYHGGSFFVQGYDMTDETESFSRYENGIAFNIYTSDVGGDRVFGIYSTGATECILNIRNAGDPGTRLEDEPWTPYLEDEEIVAAQLAAKPTGTYTAFDLSDLTISAHYNEEDGYYHLGSVDGPVIYIDLTSNTKYINSIQVICAHQGMGVYVYDDFGGLLEKRSFYELFLQYGMPSDTTPPDAPIRVPLSMKLAEAIKTYGDRADWWKPGSEQNLFTKNVPTAVYNQDYAWLLFCGVFN